VVAQAVASGNPARDSTDSNTAVEGGSFSHEQLARTPGIRRHSRNAPPKFASTEGIMTRTVSVGENSLLSKELRLSNGITLSNRIAQSAMTEHLASGDGAPSR
jgi:hypothetical protein